MGNLHLFLQQLGGIRYLFMISLLSTIIQSGLIIFFSDRTRILIDAVLAQNNQIFMGAAIGLLVLAIIRTLNGFIGGYFTRRFSEECTANIRNNVVTHISHLPLECLEKYHSGDLISRLSNDMHLVKNLFGIIIRSFASISLLSIGSLIYMLWVNWSLTVVVIITLPLLTWLTRKLTAPIRSDSRELQEALADTNAAMQDSLATIKVTKAFNLEEDRYNDFNQRVKKVFDNGMRLAYRRSIVKGWSRFCAYLPFIACLAYGGWLVATNRISPGQLVAFIQLTDYLAMPLMEIPPLLGDFKMSLAGVDRICAILNTPLERVEGNAYSLKTDKVLSFSNVDFAYGDKEVLNDLTFEVKKGETIAIVGESGCGKSTLLKLLAGFYDVQNGEISLFNQPISNWHLPSLRNYIALVTQDTYLFPGTVADNIHFGKPDACKEEVEQAAHLANAHDFIMSLPRGYDTLISESGNNLSGGQKQRLALARAILKDASLLLLDEPTSALDTESEYLVQQSLHDFMAGRTTVIVAHRLSTIKDAHRILVIAEGRIAEEGTHSELIELKGLYYKLYSTETKNDNQAG